MEIKIIIAIVISLLAIVLSKYNKLVKLRNEVKQARSGIDVYSEQRFDLIPNLVECTKAYTKYEEKVLVEISEKRAMYAKSKDLSLGKELNDQIINLLVVNENNPNLKAVEQFVNLQKSLIKIESELQAVRRIYNGDVTLYNSEIEVFPSIIIAKIFRFKPEELFEIQEYKRENIKIE